MRKISEISGVEGMRTIGRILPLIPQAIKKTGPKGTRNNLEYVGEMLQKAPDIAVELVAVLDGGSVEEYKKKNILEISKDLIVMFNDEDLLNLFESQMQTQTSSSSATENSEVKR